MIVRSFANKLFGRLSVKIGIATAAIAWISIELVVQLVFQQGIAHTRQTVRRDLTNLANIAVQTLSGDDHRAAMQGKDTAAFTRFAKEMTKLRMAASFAEQWYTFLPSTTDTVIFGIMTHPKPFSGDKHIFRDAMARQAFMTAVRRKIATSTEVYEDDNGVWISGFAPICARDGTVTGILELDLTYSQLLEREATTRNQITLIRVVGFFLGGMLGFLIGFIVARPLQMVSRKVEQFAASDFHLGSSSLMANNTLFPDETTTLITNVNQMAVQLEETLSRLRDANKRLQTLDKAKTVFLDFVAHELRTPLTQLHAIEILRRIENLSEDGLFFVESAMESIDRLRTFCFAAEQYVKALSHTPKTDEITDVAEMLPLVANEALESHLNHPIELDIRLPNGNHDNNDNNDNGEHRIVPVAMSNRLFFSSLLSIIDNAVKFSPASSKIILTLTTSDDVALIHIQDFGYGFSPEHATRIFEPFFVEDIEHHGRGTGVNLALAKVYIEHYGGSITAFSAGNNAGSTFTVTLPLAQNHASGTQNPSMLHEGATMEMVAE